METSIFMNDPFSCPRFHGVKLQCYISVLLWGQLPICMIICKCLSDKKSRITGQSCSQHFIWKSHSVFVCVKYRVHLIIYVLFYGLFPCLNNKWWSQRTFITHKNHPNIFSRTKMFISFHIPECVARVVLAHNNIN